jgi:hypothetical protein
MAPVSSFHSIYEARKPPEHRVYHDNDACPLACEIPERERVPGRANLRACKECERLNRGSPNRWL